ncbi:MAG: hypothetical protein HOC71_03945 [Candidatus Latescibacteria bacterium]|jgi:hypothetical protein|nr:hypothetical protein [Candidatus Latescibacterota bacterium]
MRKVAIILALTGLGLTVIPSIFVFYGSLAWRLHTQLMFAGMVIWFVMAPFVMKKNKSHEDI